MPAATSADAIVAVRRFSRFYTRAIGVLHEGLLGSSLTLTEGRIVYELANRQAPTATAIGHDLGLDPGYMSRVLKSLEFAGNHRARAEPRRRSPGAAVADCHRSRSL